MLARLGDVIKKKGGANYKLVDGGHVPVYSIGKLEGYTDKSISNVDGIALATQGTIGKPRLLRVPYWITSTQDLILVKDINILDVNYLFCILNELDYKQFTSAYTVRKLFEWDKFLNYEIEVPDIKTQKKIATSYFKMLDDIKKEETIIKNFKMFKEAMLNAMFVKEIHEYPKGMYNLE